MNSIPNKLIKFIVTLYLFAPIVSFVTLGIFKRDFVTTSIILSLLAMFVLLAFRTHSEPIIFPKYLLFLSLFVLYSIFVDYIYMGKMFDAKILIADRMLGTFYLFFLIENFKPSKEYFEFILKYSKPILFVAVVVIVFQQAYSDSFLVNPDYQKVWGNIGESESRLPSIYSYLGGGIATGLGFVPLLIILVDYLKRNNKQVLFWVLGGIIFGFLSKYRWIMVNTFLLFIVLIINSKQKFSQILKYSLLIPVFLFLSFFVLKSAGVKVDQVIEERILESDNTSNNTSYSTRLLAFHAFKELFFDNPILGKGNVKYGIGGSGKQDYKLRRILGGHSSQIHIGYLSLLYYYGIVGGVLYFGFLLLLFKRMHKNAKRTGIYGPIIAMACFLITNLVMVSFNLLEIGIVIALVADKYYSMNWKKTNRLNT